MSCPRCGIVPIVQTPDGLSVALVAPLGPLPPDPELPMLQQTAPLGFQMPRVCQQCGTVYCPRVQLSVTTEAR